MDDDQIKKDLIRDLQDNIKFNRNFAIYRDELSIKNNKKNVKIIIDSLGKEEVVDGVLTDDEIFKYMENNLQNYMENNLQNIIDSLGKEEVVDGFLTDDEIFEDAEDSLSDSELEDKSFDFKNENIKVAVKYEKGSFDPGPGWSIHYSIYNNSDKKIKFNIGETGLFSNNVLRDRDYYLTGHIVTDFELPPKNHITGADIYLKANGNFKVNDKFYIKIEDLSRSEEYILYFEKISAINTSLKCISHEIHENPLLNLKSFESKLLNSIERLESMEDKIGFKIENLSVKISMTSIKVFGDFFMDEFDDYYNISFNATYYDKNNDILATSSSGTIYFDDFLGFESFKISNYFDDPSEVAKIRLYPKISRR